MPVDNGLVSLYKEKYSTLLDLTLQQKGSKLRDTVVVENTSGARIVSPVQYMDPVSTAAPQGRFSPVVITPATYSRRWYAPLDRELVRYVDTFDKLKTDIDVTGGLVMSAAYACGRDYDDEIIAAATRAATIGDNPASLSTETFDTSKFRVPVTFGAGSTDVGLTVAKLIEARRILRANHVDLDMEEVCLVIGAKQEADLLDQVQIVSKDFNMGMMTDNGSVTRVLGMNVKVLERLNVSGGNASVLVYAKSGIFLGIWSDMHNAINQDHTRSGHPWQVYTSHSYGATRGQPGKVVEILCKNT